MNNRRRVLYGSKDSIDLPAGFKLLQYVKTTNSAFKIRAINKPFDFEINFHINNVYSSYYYDCLIGVNGYFQVGYNESGYASNGNATSSNKFFTAGNDYTVQAHFSTVTSETSYSVNGIDTGLHRQANLSNIYVLGNGGGYRCHINVYSITISTVDGIIHKYYPVKTEDNIYGLYDIIDEEFINKGFTQ